MNCLQVSGNTEMEPITFHHGEKNKAAFIEFQHVTEPTGNNPAFISSIDKSLFHFERLVEHRPRYTWVVYCQLMTGSHHVSRVRNKRFYFCSLTRVMGLPSSKLLVMELPDIFKPKLILEYLWMCGNDLRSKYI